MNSKRYMNRPRVPLSDKQPPSATWPGYVREEIITLLAEALVEDLQENQQVRSNMGASPSGNHHNKRESDEGILRGSLNK